jgi:hypothetical protein
VHTDLIEAMAERRLEGALEYRIERASFGAERVAHGMGRAIVFVVARRVERTFPRLVLTHGLSGRAFPSNLLLLAPGRLG